MTIAASLEAEEFSEAENDSQVNLHDIAGVLSEESVMGAPDKGDDLQQAPILGEELLKVDNLLQEDSLASGAGSVQDLQRKIEQVMSELQTRFDQQQERFKRRWLDLSFDEPDIEEDFRQMTFDGHRKYMYAVAVGVLLYCIFAGLFFNILPMYQLRNKHTMPNATCIANLPPYARTLLLSGNVTMTNLTVLTSSPTLALYVEAQYRNYVAALVYRFSGAIVLVIMIAAIKVAPRRFALATMILVRVQAVPALPQPVCARASLCVAAPACNRRWRGQPVSVWAPSAAASAR